MATGAETAVVGTRGISLVPAAIVSASYPRMPEVPGVWVRGPDAAGRYSVELHVAIKTSSTKNNLLVDAENLRSMVWAEFRRRELAEKVERVDVVVEDIDIAV